MKFVWLKLENKKVPKSDQSNDQNHDHKKNEEILCLERKVNTWGNSQIHTHLFVNWFLVSCQRDSRPIVSRAVSDNDWNAHEFKPLFIIMHADVPTWVIVLPWKL